MLRQFKAEQKKGTVVAVFNIKPNIGGKHD
jgi:sugar phosphate permease